MSRVMVVGSGPINIRIAEALASMAVHVVPVEVISSPYDHLDYNPIRHTEFRDTEFYRKLTRFRYKYDPECIEFRRRSMIKRRKEKARQMARKLARNRERAPVLL